MNQDPSVLCVDDDEIFLKMLRKYFQVRHANYTVQTCPSGEECLDLLRTYNPDLLVVDYHLHGKDASMQGAPLLKAIKATGTSARLVVLSGRDRDQIMPILAKEQIEEYIVKDMNALSELEKVIQKYFG